jgi:hypothetical protein
MIDWCIENPIKGNALDPNDPELRLLEAYILAQRQRRRAGLRKALGAGARRQALHRISGLIAPN